MELEQLLIPSVLSIHVVDLQITQVKQKNFLIHQPLHMKCSM